MTATKNYFAVDDKLKSILFTEESVMRGQGQLELNFNVKGVNHGYYCLTYYGFNILLSQTVDQNTIYHTLTNEFFDEFSFHKNKMFFCGILGDNSFTPNEINYKIPTNKMGIYVRKRILNAFKDRGIDLIIKKKSTGTDDITRLIIL